MVDGPPDKQAAIPRAIVGFRSDEDGWPVAVLTCGHGQHVRHRPPLESRPWVETAEGRAGMLGHTLGCKRCAEGEPACPPVCEELPAA